jgi:ribosomal protein S18 acetylase RimI-like enzyme
MASNDDIRLAIRPATEADAALLTALNGAVQAVHAALLPDEFRRTADTDCAVAFFGALLGRPEQLFRIAEWEGAAAGYLWAELQERPETPFTFARPRLYIHHLSVNADRRRRGVGAALLREAERCAALAGSLEIALDTWSLNAPATAFFAARGYEPFRVMLRKPAPQARSRVL